VITLLDPWTAVAPGASEALEKELRRELSPGHILHGLSLRAVARRTDRDDVVFEARGSGECAAVHLTWTGRTERPPFPTTRRFASLDAWASTAMAADHQEFENGG
jgi:hypothetical protein